MWRWDCLGGQALDLNGNMPWVHTMTNVDLTLVQRLFIRASCQPKFPHQQSHGPRGGWYGSQGGDEPPPKPGLFLAAVLWLPLNVGGPIANDIDPDGKKTGGLVTYGLTHALAAPGQFLGGNAVMLGKPARFHETTSQLAEFGTYVADLAISEALIPDFGFLQMTNDVPELDRPIAFNYPPMQGRLGLAVFGDGNGTKFPEAAVNAGIWGFCDSRRDEYPNPLTPYFQFDPID